MRGWLCLRLPCVFVHVPVLCCQLRLCRVHYLRRTQPSKPQLKPVSLSSFACAWPPVPNAQNHHRIEAYLRPGRRCRPTWSPRADWQQAASRYVAVLRRPTLAMLCFPSYPRPVPHPLHLCSCHSGNNPYCSYESQWRGQGGGEVGVGVVEHGCRMVEWLVVITAV